MEVGWVCCLNWGKNVIIHARKVQGKKYLRVDTHIDALRTLFTCILDNAIETTIYTTKFAYLYGGLLGEAGAIRIEIFMIDYWNFSSSCR